MFIFSGAFHYFRCPKELWRDRFVKMKAAGLNTVETYVPWNYHEAEMPASLEDYSKLDLTEFIDWLKMAEDEFDFYVIVRPGPYICAEWDGGGFPQWLLTKRPKDFGERMWLRSDEPNFVAWSKHWMDAVAKVVAPHQLTHRERGKTGVILWQIENEYDFAAQPDAVKINYINALAHWSREDGIDVPLITCVTARVDYRADPFIKQNVVETRNVYPGFKLETMKQHLDVLHKYQPDKFGMITELQGGWFANVGGKLSTEQGFTAEQITHVTLLAMESGITSMNYYMFFGGTNFGDRAARGITTTYDYDAPIHECGGVGDRYAAVSAIGQMLKEHGPRLARSEIEKSQDDSPVVVRRAQDGSRYVFVRNEHHEAGQHGKLRLLNGPELTHELPPFGAKVAYVEKSGTIEWLPKPVVLPARPEQSELPKPITINEVLSRDEPQQQEFRPIQHGQTLEDLGVFDSRFVFYQLAAGRTSTDDVLAVDVPPGDAIVAMMDGQVLKTRRGKHTWHVDFPTDSRRAPVTLLYENSGHANGSIRMEQRKGLTNFGVVPRTSSSTELRQWRMLEMPDDFSTSDLASRTEVKPDFDDSGWPAVDVERKGKLRRPNSRAIYRISIKLSDTEAAAPRRLIFGGIDDEGWIFVNGEQIAHTTDWEQEHAVGVNGKLHAGTNVIAVVVNNTGGTGGLSDGVSLEPIVPRGNLLTDVQVCTVLVSARKQWWSESLDESAWQKSDIHHSPATAPDGQPLLRWYRMHFSLSASSPKMWTPWKLRIDATGNGFVYLNGHALGRYWQVGPQREFYLPECWLSRGDGKENVIALSLRQTDEPPALRAAEISVYADLCEKR
jgi:hypothetical protein